MTTVFRASLETRNFLFEAFEENRTAAKTVLIYGLERHGIQYGLEPNWHESYHDEIAIVPIELGLAMRDREAIPAMPEKPDLEAIKAIALEMMKRKKGLTPSEFAESVQLDERKARHLLSDIYCNDARHIFHVYERKGITYYWQNKEPQK